LGHALMHSESLRGKSARSGVGKQNEDGVAKKRAVKEDRKSVKEGGLGKGPPGDDGNGEGGWGGNL